MRDCERGEVLARRGQKAARRFAHELAQADPRLRSAAHRGPPMRIYDCDCERGEDLARRHQKAACRFSGGLQHESHVPRLAVLKKRFRTGCELLAGCRWTHSADEQKGPGDSQRTRARLRSLPSSCIRRGAACPYQIFACASAPRSTPPVPMAQRWPRSPLGPMPEISFARPPSPTAGHSNPIVSLRRQRASPVEARRVSGFRGVVAFPKDKLVRVSKSGQGANLPDG